MRRFLFLALLLVLPVPFAAPAAASSRLDLTIETRKPFGPAAGTFTTTGAFADTGGFVNTRFTFSAVGAPSFVIIHATQHFTGAAGSFTIEATITETVTSDPNILTDTGTWTVIDGTGAYQALHGQGRVTGTADDTTGVISRTYTASVG